MLFYLTLFLVFLYFKIARVHYKSEKLSVGVVVQHFFVAISAVMLVLYGVSHVAWYLFAGSAMLFFIAAGLMIAAIQVGIFIEGKPFIKLSMVFKAMPFLTVAIVILSIVASN